MIDKRLGFDSYCFTPTIKMSVEKASKGEERLALICEEARKLQLHLPKASVPQIQDHLLSCEREWKNFLDSCSQNQRELNESIDLLKK